jgi:hypothetical protein
MEKMKRLVSLFAALFLVAPLVSAEIFKCTEASGLLKLQNFPCSIDSIGSMATAIPLKDKTTMPTVTAGISARTSPVEPTPRVHTLRAIIPTGEESNGEEPYRGMTMNEVRAQWGDPKSAKEMKGVEIWYYDGPGDSTRGVRFDLNGRVVGIVDEDWQPDSDGG